MSSGVCTWLVYFVYRHPHNWDPADKKKGPHCERSQLSLWCFSHVRVEGLLPWSELTTVPTFLIGMECAEVSTTVRSSLNLLVLQCRCSSLSFTNNKMGRPAGLTESQKSALGCILRRQSICWCKCAKQRVVFLDVLNVQVILVSLSPILKDLSSCKQHGQGGTTHLVFWSMSTTKDL